MSLEITNLLNYTQAAEYIHKSRPTLYKLIEDGFIRPIKIGTVSYIFREELDRYLNDGKKEGR